MAKKWTPVRAPRLHHIGQRKLKEDLNPVPTPWTIWNDACGEEGGRKGLGRGWLVLLGGLPGEGKTGCVLNMAAHACKAGHSVGFVNMEMTHEGAVTRFLSIMTGVPREVLDRGAAFDPKAWGRATQAIEKGIEEHGHGQLYTFDSSIVTPENLSEAYEDLAAEEPSLVIVDYAQLIQVRGGGDNLYQKTGEVAATLAGLSKEFDVATLAASQLTRKTEYKTGKAKEPNMQDLAEGSPWERFANQIMLIDHTKSESLAFGRRKICLKNAKNRHGEKGFRVHTTWDFETMIMS